MNVLMIEQEKAVALRMREILAGIDESIHIVAIASSMTAAVEWLDENQVPDIILANKQISAGLEQLVKRDIKATVTFSTNQEEFDFRAFRYKTIRSAMKEPGFLNELSRINYQKPVSVAKPSMSVAYKERFLVKQGQKLQSIAIEQIAYFFSEDRFIFFRTFDNQKFLLEYRIEQLETMLPPGRFFRLNRTFIVSMASVREIHAYFGNRLKLYLSPAAEKDVIVSRKRVSDFKTWLGK